MFLRDAIQINVVCAKQICCVLAYWLAQTTDTVSNFADGNYNTSSEISIDPHKDLFQIM